MYDIYLPSMERRKGRRMNPINWYPGHMAKAKRQLAEHLKYIDVIAEVVDARAPRSSRNPDFDDLFRTKERVIFLNKCDLADPSMTEQWSRHFRAEGFRVGKISSILSDGKSQAIRLMTDAAQKDVDRMNAKGVQKTVRAMIVGIPNVGKSTFINCIAGENRALAADRPGVTKGNQWVKITPYLELLDSPGLLWPKLENQADAMHLAFLGSINDDILESESLAWELLRELRVLCPEALTARYKSISSDTSEEELLEAVCKSRGFIKKGGIFDTERAAKLVLDEFRGGKIAHVTLERPLDSNKSEDLNPCE